jgi:hypothetical protein
MTGWLWWLLLCAGIFSVIVVGVVMERKKGDD